MFIGARVLLPDLQSPLQKSPCGSVVAGPPEERGQFIDGESHVLMIDPVDPLLNGHAALVGQPGLLEVAGRFEQAADARKGNGHVLVIGTVGILENRQCAIVERLRRRIVTGLFKKPPQALQAPAHFGVLGSQLLSDP